MMVEHKLDTDAEQPDLTAAAVSGYADKQPRHARSNDPIRTLDGREVDDDLVRDALNYQILLGKIEQLLAKLGLEA